MPFGLWRKKRIIRRYGPPEAEGGYESSTCEDIVILADVQTTEKRTNTGEDGDDTLQKLKVFSEAEIKTADDSTGRKADLLWFQGKWYECRSSILSDNTMLKHWTSMFTQCANQPDAPDEEGLLNDS